MTDEAAEVVPRGERADLQRTAQETGERFGRQDQAITNHDQHFKDLNGSIARIDETTHTQATTLALLTASIAVIEKRFAQGEYTEQRKKGMSLQWQLAIFAAVIALFIAIAGFVLTVVLALVVMIANGQIQL